MALSNDTSALNLSEIIKLNYNFIISHLIINNTLATKNILTNLNMPFEIGVIPIISPCDQMHIPKIERVPFNQHPTYNK